jgi:D-alanyl-D-alanine carboxypeptidase/D-alanyl-D-alanine-endopeptidase (penicillin-binding protein 4)
MFEPVFFLPKRKKENARHGAAPWLWIATTCFLFSCSIEKKIAKSSNENILKSAALVNAYVGISIFEPATGKYWYGHNDDHYFIPASNTKLATCYAAMKYLGDSILGLSYVENDSAVFFLPNGDPTVLHPSFVRQPVIQWMQATSKKIYTTDAGWRSESLGSGWSWDDYNTVDMAERSPFPVYGNLIKWVQEDSEEVMTYSIPEVPWTVNFETAPAKNFYVQRKMDDNIYSIRQGKEKYKEQWVPFNTKVMGAALQLLPDTIHKQVGLLDGKNFHAVYDRLPMHRIFTQALDSVLKIMMHVSDNFMAEQSLMMVSNRLLGVMDDGALTDSLTRGVYADMPQRPRWADGSGMSRYNLFTPRDFIYLLSKMRNEFGSKRMETILATGNTGTLRNYYKADSGFIFAKTGTLSGVVALSGYLYTKKNHLLIFSILVNNHTGPATPVRRAIEKFLEGIREKY